MPKLKVTLTEKANIPAFLGLLAYRSRTGYLTHLLWEEYFT
jgi:hypothetical protein